MSLAIEPLAAYGLLDPVVMQNAKTYPVVTGARAVSYQVNAPTSISGGVSGQIYFDVNPAHENVYVDRLMYVRLPVRMKIDLGTNANTIDGKYILREGCFGLRSFPIQKALDTIVLNINGLQSSIEIGKIMSALELFDVKQRMRQVDCSKCATYPINQSQQFSSLYGTARNPLGLRGAGPEGALNLGSQYTVLLNAATAGGAGTSTGVAWVDFVSVEALHLSPLYFSAAQDDHSAFLGINSMSIQLNIGQGAGNRMIAIDPVSNDGILTEANAYLASCNVTCTMWFNDFTQDSAVSAIAFSYPSQSQCAILVKQLAPSEVDENLKLKIKNYPYTQTRVFITNIGSLASGASWSNASANMQLASIPPAVLVWGRVKDSLLRQNPFYPDTFLAMSALTAVWGVDNRLNGASVEQLYDISVINGLEVDFQSWAGIPFARTGQTTNFGKSAYRFAGCGSVCKFGPMDLGLPLRQAPGKSEYFNLQVTPTFTNVAANTLTNCDLFVCVVSQGVYSIYDGQASSTLGILSENDVLNANKTAYSHMLSYNEAREVFGGAMADNLKQEMKSVLEHGPNKVARSTLRERLSK